MGIRRLTITAVIAAALLPLAPTAHGAGAPAATPLAVDLPAAVPQGMEGVNPTRILDTRTGIGASGAVGHGGSIDVQVTGQGGVPSSGVGAVVLNVTVADPTVGGYVTVWPTGSPQPNASNLNFVAGQTIPNLVIVKVGSGGKVSLYNAYGSTHLIADVSGYYTTDSQMVATNPTRLLDTRSGDAVSGRATVQVSGLAGVPSTGATAVIANVTVADPTSGGYLTMWPTGESQPNASNLNFARGETRPNLVIAKLGDEGKVDLYVSGGRAHVLIDVLGYVTSPPYLTELLDRVDSNGSFQEVDQLQVDGTTRFHSLRHNSWVDTTPRWAEYNLGRQWTTLSTTLAFDDDDGRADSRIRFRILGDGKVLTDQTLNFGQTTPVALDVTGVLRVRFEVTSVGIAYSYAPVFVDPELRR